MTASEVWFLRAEAKLREFTGANESVQNCYEKAVRLSFEQWGATNADEYLQSNSQPSDYKDVFFESNDMKAVSTITPKWDALSRLLSRLLAVPPLLCRIYSTVGNDTSSRLC